MKKRRNNDTILQIRLPSALRDRLKLHLKQDKREASEFVRSFIELYLLSRERLTPEDRANFDVFLQSAAVLLRSLANQRVE